MMPSNDVSGAAAAVIAQATRVNFDGLASISIPDAIIRASDGGGFIVEGAPVRSEKDVMHERLKLYDRRSWRRRARLQLTHHPLCQICERKGKILPAAVADHIVPHNGDEKLFQFGELQSLCISCHAIKTAKEQGQNLKAEIGLDGWPIE